MPFLFRNLTLAPTDSDDSLALLAASKLRIPPSEISDFRIVRKGVDARHKARIKLVFTVSFFVANQQELLVRMAQIDGLEWQADAPAQNFPALVSAERIVIVGSGPAGLFTALRLAEYGLAATIIERGQPVEQRAKDVEQFWKDGALDPESNVQFGEGGAGTFSDGKLTCRSKDPHVAWILERLADFGAPQEICYLAKPHIGTDRLRCVVSSIREYLISKNFTFYFASRLSDIVTHKGRIVSAVINGNGELPCDRLVLATGHSARDVYQLLATHGVPIEQKPFAMGLRVEHPQQLIDRIQYGAVRHPGLPVADYAVTWNNPVTRRSAYSFCMCPGGVVIGGASEIGGVVTNGMSGQQRNSPFANSALVVNVTTNDFGAADPLAGVRFQQKWEQKAFELGGGTYRAPAQNLLSFLRLPGSGAARTTYRPGITETDLEVALPQFIIQTLREGIPDFGKKMRGFVSAEATLVGIESRTSAPVRVPRDEQFESIGLKGLYPAGEGAGYAGGIMSSAVDGVRIADKIASKCDKHLE